MNADIRITASVNSVERQYWKPFTPSISCSQVSELETDLDNYTTTVNLFTIDLYTIWLNEVARLVTNLASQSAHIDPHFVIDPLSLATDVGVHIAIRLDNVTHPTPAAGVVPLPKRHLDFAYTGTDLLAEDDVATAFAVRIKNEVMTFAQSAKYVAT